MILKCIGHGQCSLNGIQSIPGHRPSADVKLKCGQVPPAWMRAAHDSIATMPEDSTTHTLYHRGESASLHVVDQAAAMSLSLYGFSTEAMRVSAKPGKGPYSCVWPVAQQPGVILGCSLCIMFNMASGPITLSAQSVVTCTPIPEVKSHT